jgi:hypothetical protein
MIGIIFSVYYVFDCFFLFKYNNYFFIFIYIYIYIDSTLTVVVHDA